MEDVEFEPEGTVEVLDNDDEEELGLLLEYVEFKPEGAEEEIDNDDEEEIDNANEEELQQLLEGVEFKTEGAEEEIDNDDEEEIDNDNEEKLQQLLEDVEFEPAETEAEIDNDLMTLEELEDMENENNIESEMEVENILFRVQHNSDNNNDHISDDITSPVENTRYNCINKICFETYGDCFTEYELKAHMINEHKKPITNECDHCDMFFTDRNHQNRHKRKNHPGIQGYQTPS